MSENPVQTLDIPVEEAVVIERGDRLHKVIKFARKNGCVTVRDGVEIFWVWFEGASDAILGLTEDELRREFARRHRR